MLRPKLSTSLVNEGEAQIDAIEDSTQFGDLGYVTKAAYFLLGVLAGLRPDWVTQQIAKAGAGLQKYTVPDVPKDEEEEGDKEEGGK